ncbi:MAG: redoxin family protein, partial [Gammaproteobacteria bacterium]|nr:redoxin family protein [Gammaproteobacteria bacterium]
MTATARRSRWLPLAVFGLIAALLAAGVWLSRNPDRDALPSPLIGLPAPEFSLPVLHSPDYMVTAEDLRGQPYVLNVWGSWCPGCRDEHPVLTDFAETRRVRMVGYN